MIRKRIANIPALQVKSSGTVIAAEQISSLTAAIAGVMVRGSASSSGLPLWFASLLSILRAWRCEKLLNLLEQIGKYILSMHVVTQRSPGPDRGQWRVASHIQLVYIYFVLVSTFQTGHFCTRPALDKLTKANVHKRLISILQFAFIMIHLILNTGIFNSHKTVIRGTAEGQTGLPPLGPQTCPNRTESSGSPFCPTFTLLKCSINTQSDSSSRVVQTQSG